MKVYAFKYSRDGENWHFYHNGEGRLGIYTDLGVAKRVANKMVNSRKRWGQTTEVEMLEATIEWTVI
jgi:hypothetical protein